MKIVLHWLLVGIILSHSLQLQAKDSSLHQCQSLSTKIDNYREKRRKGASGAQMSKWKIQLRDVRTDYRQGRCWRFGAKLRNK